MGWAGKKRSRKYHSQWRGNSEQRKARMAALLERDRMACWLCGNPVSLEAPLNHPLRPSVDHVIPRSQGGTKDLENLRLAHFGCNSKRGAA